jgi:hypothetical protein
MFICFFGKKHNIHTVHSYIAFIQPFSLLSFILHCTWLWLLIVITSNGNTFYDGNGYDTDIESIVLDAELSVAVMRVSQQKAAALLKMQCMLEVAPRSVACPVERARRLAAWTGSVAMMKEPQRMAAALLQMQYKLQVAPRSVARPVTWAVQALQGRWVVPV